MRYSSRGRPAQGLHQGALNVGQLVAASLTAQLQGSFDDLVYTGGASGVAARLQTAKGGHRQQAVPADLILLGQFPALAAAGKPRCLQ